MKEEKTESIRIDKKLVQAVRENAKLQSRTIAATVGLAIKQYLGLH